jgi:hypothetical protein
MHLASGPSSGSGGMYILTPKLLRFIPVHKSKCPNRTSKRTGIKRRKGAGTTKEANHLGRFHLNRLHDVVLTAINAVIYFDIGMVYFDQCECCRSPSRHANPPVVVSVVVGIQKPSSACEALVVIQIYQLSSSLQPGKQ